jgi:hypothetical protein
MIINYLPSSFHTDVKKELTLSFWCPHTKESLHLCKSKGNWSLRKHFKFRSHNKQLLRFERSEAPNKHISKQQILKWSYEYCAQFYLTFHDLDNSKQLDNAKTSSDAFMKIIPHNCLRTTDQTKAHLCSLLLSQPIPRAIQQVVRRMIQRWLKRPRIFGEENPSPCTFAIVPGSVAIAYRSHHSR